MKAIAWVAGLVVLAGCQGANRECCMVAAERPAAVAMGLPEMEEAVLALSMALEDERKSEAMYMAIMRVHGERRPFSMVVNSERSHQRALEAQFARLGAELPAEPVFEFEVPGTFEAACAMAAETERENMALYDAIEPKVSDPQILRVFSRLRSASESCHLPAFERAAGGDASGGCGVGGGSCGQGQGKGMGKGCGGGCGGA